MADHGDGTEPVRTSAEEPEGPTVSVIVPVLNEELHLDDCLAAIEAQTYPGVVEVLVIDGGSTDRTRDIAATYAVRVLDNPARIQAAALNVGIEAARGDVVVRVDGHCTIAPDYVERCVADLASTGAAMVGGGMTPVATGPMERAIAVAMASSIGAGPAKFHVSDTAAWVDTVYLGAYRTDLARAVGGYATDMIANEDAEFAVRMADHGGIWYDPDIRSTYTPRRSLVAVARQFYRYGRGRATTVRRHPTSLSPRQLVAPALVLGLVSPWRRWVGGAYLSLVVGWSVVGIRRGRTPISGAVLPAMHLPWGVGFLVGIVTASTGTTHPTPSPPTPSAPASAPVAEAAEER